VISIILASNEFLKESNARKAAIAERVRVEEARVRATEEKARQEAGELISYKAIYQELIKHINTLVPQGDALFIVSAHDFVPSRGELVDFIRSQLYKHSYMEGFISQYNANLARVSQDAMTNTDYERGRRLDPREYKGSDVIEQYLAGTSFVPDIQGMRIGIGIPDDLRPHHGVIFGASGSGKTQLIEKLILADLAKEDRPCIIVIDSKDDIIPRVASLPRFNTDLADKILIIDHRDKPALNMFDVGEVTNEKVNAVESGMKYFFGSLLGEELSGQMNTLFTPLLHIVLRVPGATLGDLRDLVRNPLMYPDIIAQLPPRIRRFVETEMVASRSEDPYRQTKQSLITRIQGIINKGTLDEMFSAPANSVDLLDAIEQRKVILISTDANGLQDLSPIFGRFWISQIMNAGRARGSKYGADRPNVHFYIDECAPYVDDKLVSMLTTIRSYGVGVMLAFQGPWQMGTYASAILQNTAVKFASGDVGLDLPGIVPVKSTKTVGAFSLYYSDLPHTLNVRFQFGELDRLPAMSKSAYHKLRRLNRQRLQSVSTPRYEPEVVDLPQRELESPPPGKPKETKGRKPKKSDPDIDINPSSTL